MTNYEHTQIGYVLICGLLGAAALVGSGTIIRNNWIAFVIAAILLLTIAGFYKLTIKIENETLRAAFGIGLIRKEVPLVEVASCEPFRIRWWYGWGIHLTPRGWLYNVAGWDAVAIRLRSGKEFALGTDEPQALVEAIRRLASAR